MKISEIRDLEPCHGGYIAKYRNRKMFIFPSPFGGVSYRYLDSGRILKMTGEASRQIAAMFSDRYWGWRE